MFEQWAAVLDSGYIVIDFGANHSNNTTSTRNGLFARKNEHSEIIDQCEKVKRLLHHQLIPHLSSPFRFVQVDAFG